MGIIFYVCKFKGLIKLFVNYNFFFIFLDGLYLDNLIDGVFKLDRFLLIVGGVGIMGVLLYIVRYINVKICWSVKVLVEGLVWDLEGLLFRVVEKDVRVGSRLDVVVLLVEEEWMGWSRVGVVVCGFGGFCDDIWVLVIVKVWIGLIVWEFEVDVFFWQVW